MMVIRFLLLLAFLGGTSCKYFVKSSAEDLVAKIDEDILLKSELESVGKGLSNKDSLLRVSEYIRNWAKDKLFFKQAKLNLSDEDMNRFEKLVNEYRRDIYSKAYINIITNEFSDTIIKKSDYKSFYNDRKQNFKLHNNIIRIRYMHLSGNLTRSSRINIVEKFQKVDKDSLLISELEDPAFRPYFFNDSIWISVESLKQKIKNLSLSVLKKSIDKNKLVILKTPDKKNIFVAKVIELKKQGDVAPLSFIKPTIQKIIINSRKQKFIQEIENEIVNKAIQKNKLIIYD